MGKKFFLMLMASAVVALGTLYGCGQTDGQSPGGKVSVSGSAPTE